MMAKAGIGSLLGYLEEVSCGARPQREKLGVQRRELQKRRRVVGKLLMKVDIPLFRRCGKICLIFEKSGEGFEPFIALAAGDTSIRS